MTVQPYLKVLLSSLSLALVFLGGNFSFLSMAAQAQVGHITQPLTQAQDDDNTPRANSTVRIVSGSGSLCSGTLITPDIVLTAGHCGFHNDAEGRCPNRWVPITHGEISVMFGFDQQEPLDEIPVTHWNISGSEDMIMLALERPVSPDIAVPRRPLTWLPVNAESDAENFWEKQKFILSGWGGTDPDSHSGNLPRIRQVAQATKGELHCGQKAKHFNKMCVEGVDGSSVRGGDSGGPL